MGRRKSNDHVTSPKSPHEGDHHPPSSPTDARSFAAFNPTTQQLKSASTSSVGLSSGEHIGNVFAAIDPTVGPGGATSPSPASVRRTGSDRSGVSGGRIGGKFSTRPPSERFGSNGRMIRDQDGDEQQLQSTINKVSNAFSSSSTSSLPSAKQPILPPSLPPSAAKQYMAGQQSAEQNKIKEEDDEEEDSSSANNIMSRGSVKDRTKMFHNTPIMGERPPSALSMGKSGSLKNTMHVEHPDKPEHAPSFKPPPPPTALKPKPGRKDKELAHAVVSAAVKKAQHDKDNVTHL